MTWPAIKKSLTIPEFAEYVRGFNFSPWRPQGMVLHNTGSPTLAQRPEGFLPIHLENLENYFRFQNGWSAGPHLFIDDNEPSVSLFSPMNHPGVHTPSWNGTHLGVELLGDYSTEDDETGRGARVVKNAVAVFGILHARLGLDPDKIKFHKDDPRTTHDCPGKHLFADKLEFIQSVHEYMGSGGDWKGVEPKSTQHLAVTRTPGDTLNVRSESSARGSILEALPDKTQIEIIGSAMNGSTKWLRINHQGVLGWVAARYVEEQ